jgi:hypothetical protein
MMVTIYGWSTRRCIILPSQILSRKEMSKNDSAEGKGRDATAALGKVHGRGNVRPVFARPARGVVELLRPQRAAPW